MPLSARQRVGTLPEMIGKPDTCQQGAGARPVCRFAPKPRSKSDVGDRIQPRHEKIALRHQGDPPGQRLAIARYRDAVEGDLVANSAEETQHRRLADARDAQQTGPFSRRRVE